MKFGKKTVCLLKILFLCALAAMLAFGFNVVRPKPISSFSELTAPPVSVISEIGTQDLFQDYDSGKFTFVDARSDTDYDMGHIPSALNIPYWAIGEELDGMVQQIEPGKPIIVYCDGLSCGKSMTVAKKLEAKGLRDISVYAEGIDGWISSGRDLETN
ncbi:rhodanese-like domain-containing protein [Maridesulfovibrio zosterae]|uniref:rhodanese-like domain-containing protein n=1 Tax=Maridesulfovibrio zosterae TaxID=82171 RepID=UPI0003F81CF7|nr:rhodanese-like domain-containing protein [Maridesulfovibrio zosterae]